MKFLRSAAAAFCALCLAICMVACSGRNTPNTPGNGNNSSNAEKTLSPTDTGSTPGLPIYSLSELSDEQINTLLNLMWGFIDDSDFTALSGISPEKNERFLYYYYTGRLSGSTEEPSYGLISIDEASALANNTFGISYPIKTDYDGSGTQLIYADDENYHSLLSDYPSVNFRYVSQEYMENNPNVIFNNAGIDVTIERLDEDGRVIATHVVTVMPAASDFGFNIVCINTTDNI